MKRVAIVVLSAGCSALFGIDKIPYESGDGSVPGPIDLSVMLVGQGNGKVTDSTMTISCTDAGGSCSATYDAGSKIMLAAAPMGTSTFEQWAGGACSGSTSPCMLTDASGTVDVVAEFEDIAVGDNKIILQPTTTGSGSGSYIMGSMGDQCPAGMPCTFGVAPGTTSVTLTGVSGCVMFEMFSGDGCPMNSDTCTVGFPQGSTGVSVVIMYTYSTFKVGTGSGSGSGSCS